MDKDEVNLTPIGNPSTDFSELLRESQHLAQSGHSCEALSLLDKAENCLRTDSSITPSERDRHMSRICINRGITYKNMRDLEKSATCYEQAMGMLNRIDNGALREKFSVELNLAVLRTRLKERSRAIEGFDNAQKIALEFNEPEKSQLLAKVLTNRAQLYLEFGEVEKARELLDNVASLSERRDSMSRQERHARVSAQLGQLIAQIAEHLDKRQHADEYYNQSLKFFEEARKCYEELGLTREALNQNVNIAEAMIALGRTYDASDTLREVYRQAVSQQDQFLIASTTEKLLIIAIITKDKDAQVYWLDSVIKAAMGLSGEARDDYLERIESRLRWNGGEHLIEKIQKLRGQEAVN